MEFFGCVFCGPTSSCVLSFTPYTAVINGRTRGSHQAVLWENSTKTQCSQALVFRAPSSFWPSFPFIGSFSCHRSPRQGRVFCPTSLSPHLSLRTGHLAGALPTPLPRGPSLCTCVRGHLPPLSRGEFSHWAQTEGLLQLCLHKDILTKSPVRWREGSVQQVPLVMTIFLNSFWPNLIYLPYFNEAPSYNTTTVISHQVGSQTWSHSLLPSVFYRSGLETLILHSSASYGQMDWWQIISSHGKNVNKVRSTALL